MGVFNVINGNGSLTQIGSFGVPTIFKGTFSPAASYTAGYCVGGLLSLAAGATYANLPFLAQLISVEIPSVQVGASLIAQLLEANPAASTYTDDAAAVLNAVDQPK